MAASMAAKQVALMDALMAARRADSMAAKKVALMDALMAAR